jgi:hypothetical protein
MVNLAIGGGSNRNNATNLNKGPQDMLIKYLLNRKRKRRKKKKRKTKEEN